MDIPDYEFALRKGAELERQRLVTWLREKHALRNSIDGYGLVLYTMYGAIDITEKELRGENENK